MIQGQTIVMRALTPDRSDMLNAALKMQHQNPKYIFPELQVWGDPRKNWNLSALRNEQLILMRKLRYEWTIITDCDCSILKFEPDSLPKHSISRSVVDEYQYHKNVHCSWWAIHVSILDLPIKIPLFDTSLYGGSWEDVDWMLKCESSGIKFNLSNPDHFRCHHHPHKRNDPDPESLNRNREIMNKRYPNRTF